MALPDITQQPRFTPDLWLADSLGRPVYRLSSGAPIGSAGLLQAQMTSLASRADAFFYAKLPTSDVRACLELSRCGFGVVDTALTLSRDTSAGQTPGGVRLGIATTEQHAGVLRIADTCFRWSRFHLDPLIPLEAANRVKHRWLQSYLEGKRGSALYAAEAHGDVAGFLAVLESSQEGRRVAIIDLLGVAQEHQGKGVGHALVQLFIQDWRGRAEELRVGTQAANLRSLRLYEQNGFRMAASDYVLHAHCRGGEIHR